MAAEAKIFGKVQTAEQEHEDPKDQLMFDPRPREEMNRMVMEMMTTTTKKFWLFFLVWGAEWSSCCLAPGAT